MEEPRLIWLGTYSAGIVAFNTDDKSWEYFVPNKKEWAIKNTNHNIIYDLAKKSATELWVASLDNGSGIFNTATRTFTFFQHVEKNINSIKSNRGFKVYKDSENITWWMNGENGLSYLDPSCQLFKYTDLNIERDQYFSDFMTDMTYDASQQKIYGVGHEIDGFYKVNQITGKVSTIPITDNAGTYQLNNAILKTSRDTLLVASNNIQLARAERTSASFSLMYYHPSKRELFPYQAKVLADLQQKNIKDIIEDSHQQIWLGTDDGLLFEYNLKDQALSHYSLKEVSNTETTIGINQIIADEKRNQIILATYKGVFSFDLTTKQFELLAGTADFSSRSVAFSKDNLLWIGTRQYGIQCYHLDQHQLILPTGIKNAPRTPIEKVFLDQKERLWATTEKGLYLYKPAHQTYYNFTAKDRLIKDNFYALGTLVLPNGDIFLGQKGGYYQFNPDELVEAIEGGTVVITDFRVNEAAASIQRTKEGSLFKELSHQQNSLNISFSTLNYCQQDKVQFVYKMEGLDQNWIIPFDNRIQANYTSMPSGNFTFKVKKVQDTEAMAATMAITIHPPWWRSWWAYACYLLLIGLSIYRLITFQLKRQVEQVESLRLKELDVFKTEFYTNITHEFRTPLTVLLGMNNQLNRYFKDRNLFRFQEGVKLINRNAAQLLRLVNQILDLNKLESKAMSLKMEQGDIVVFIKYLFESFESYAESKNIRMHFSREMESFIMDFDREKIQQILSNLLSNAIKFTPAGGLVNLHLGQKEATQFLIKVQDAGIGISKENIPFIFDRFYQADVPSDQQETGTGIGLALTKELVQLLNGSIEVHSIPKEGTTFTVLLPVTLEAASIKNIGLIKKTALTLEAFSTTQLPTALSLETNDQTNPTQAQLLIVEDNTDVILYLKACLEEQYQLSFAQDGQAGIDKAIELVPDIIISDVMMPKKDGFELCATLKTDTRTSHIPIILLTAKATVVDKIAGLEHGADAYLAKPFEPQELEVRLRKLLELRTQLQNRYINGNIPQADNNPAFQVEDEFLLKLKALIMDNLDNVDFSVAILCKSIFLSRQQVHRKLIALTGHSASHFIRSIRLQEAEKLLETTNKSIPKLPLMLVLEKFLIFLECFLKLLDTPLLSFVSN